MFFVSKSGRFQNFPQYFPRKTWAEEVSSPGFHAFFVPSVKSEKNHLRGSNTLNTFFTHKLKPYHVFTYALSSRRLWATKITQIRKSFLFFSLGKCLQPQERHATSILGKSQAKQALNIREYFHLWSSHFYRGLCIILSLPGRWVFCYDLLESCG